MKNLFFAGIIVAAMSFGITSSLAEEKKTPTAGGVLLKHVEVNIGMIAEGWSLVRLLRGEVVNESEETIGYVHDAIITPEANASYVIVNVAGYLGIPTKLIALPPSVFEVTKDRNLLLKGATKETLGNLPEFSYNPY